jgi:hypothetical protein
MFQTGTIPQEAKWMDQIKFPFGPLRCRASVELMLALDTTTEAAAIQMEIHRGLGPEARFRLAMEMSDAVLNLTRVGISHRHPKLSEMGVTQALIVALHGIIPGRS